MVCICVVKNEPYKERGLLLPWASSGRWSRGPWNIPPDGSVSVCLEAFTTDSLATWFMIGVLDSFMIGVHVSFDLQRNWKLKVLTWPPGEARDEKSATQAVCDWAPVKTLDPRSLGKHPWWAVLCVYCHTAWPGGGNAMNPQGRMARISVFHLLLHSALCDSFLAWF